MVKEVTPTATLVDAAPAAPAIVDATPDATAEHEHHGFRLLVQPGFALIAALFAGCGYSLYSIAVTSGGITTSPAAFTAIFTIALLVLVAIHEAGHVLASHLHGHRLIQVRLGMKFGVTMHGEHTRLSTGIAAAAGPVVGTAISLLVMVATPTWSPIWTAALVSMIENVANVALFFMPGSDGSKIVTAIRGPRTVVTPDTVPAT